MTPAREQRLSGRRRWLDRRLAAAPAGTSGHAALALAVAALRSPRLYKCAVGAVLGRRAGYSVPAGAAT